MSRHHSPVRSRSLRQAIVLATLLGCALPVAAQQSIEPTSATQSFSIAAQPLDSALTQFADQAGLRIIFNAGDVAGLRSSGLNGSYALAQALSQLLQGSGYGFEFVDGKTLTLRKAAADSSAVELGATSISGRLQADATTEGSNSYTATGPSSTASGLNLSLRETPQSVTVVTRQRMDDENIRSLQDVATTVTGLTYTVIGSERPTFYSRGFAVDTLQYDGVASGLIAQGGIDGLETLSLENMVLYDRVEVVRGANGLMQGAGNPSAAINLVRKRPTRAVQLSTQFGAGSWDNYSSQVDVSGPLIESGKLRARAVAYYNDRNNFRDYVGKENQILYLIGELDLTDSTVFTLGGTVQKDDSRGYDWAGQPYQADGSYYNISRSTSLQGDAAYLDKTNHQLFSEVAHTFANDWKITGKANYAWNHAEFLSGWANRYSGDVFTINYLYQDYDTNTRNFNLSTSGPFELFGTTHELMLGANYDNAEMFLNRQKYADQAFTDTVLVDIYNPDLSQVARPTYSNLQDLDVSVNSKSKGIFSATRLTLTDRTRLILGVRASDYIHQFRENITTLYTETQQENGVVTPYGGLVYEIDNHHSVYASYTDIFTPQNLYSVSGSRLDPLLGANYEAGLKSEFWAGRLNTSIAVFQLDQENRAVAMNELPQTCGPMGTSTCYRAVDKVRNRGFELEASGLILPGWNIAAGYTYSNPKASDGSDITEFSPRRMLKLSSSYQLPGPLDAWTLGGNIHTQSKTNSGPRVQEAYTLLHLRAGYRINENLDVQYSLKNVFDKKYYIYDTTFGEPRNFMLTLNYKL